MTNLPAQPGSGHIAQTPGAGGRSVVATRPRRGSRGAPTWLLWGLTVGSPIVLFALWWAVSAGSTNPFFPPLPNILVKFQELWLFANFTSDIVPSLTNLIVSYALAVLIGVALGTLLGLNKTASAMLDPIVHFWRAIPPVALVPIIVALFGFGNETRIFAITIAAFFPTLIATIDGLRSVEPLVKDMSRVYQLTPFERVVSVYLPSASPRIAAGMQVSLQSAFVVMIASEMLGSATGIGAKTLLAQQSFAITEMWSGILLLGIIGFLANALFEIIQRRALAWHLGAQAQGRES